MKRLILAGIFSGLSGCAYQTAVVTADGEHIAIKAGQYANPGPEATNHCARYGKRADFEGSSGGIYRFRCVPKQS